MVLQLVNINSIYIWNIKNKTNELIKQKLTQKCRVVTSGERERGRGKKQVGD